MKLIDALKKKFAKPEDALAALGLDAATIAMDEVKHDPKTGQFASSVSGGNPTKGESADHRREHQEAQVFHGKMAKHHKGRGEHEQAAAHSDASEAHGEAAEANAWSHSANLEGKSAVYSSQAAREASIHANHKSGYGEGFAKDRKPPRLAGDTKENQHMTTKPKWSPAALVAMGAMQQYLVPRLAQDSMIDLKPVFSGVTAKNFAAQKPYITAKIRAAVNGNLAQDADVEDLPEMLDQIESLAGEASEAVGGEVGPDPAADPDATKDAGDPDDDMGAGDPDDTDNSGFVDETESAAAGESDVNEIEDFLRDKLSPEDLDTVCAMMKASKAGGAIDTNKEPMMDAKAMDSAIRKAVKVAVDAAEQRHAAVVEATRIVRPYVGDLRVAFDSAEQVYRHALEAIGVSTKGVHKDALPAILAAQPKAGGRREPRVAQDSAAATTSFDKMFPSASRIGQM